MNWQTLNRKVLSKFGFVIPPDVIENIIKAETKDVQLFLFGLRRVIEDKLKGRSASDEGTQVRSAVFTNRKCTPPCFLIILTQIISRP